MNSPTGNNAHYNDGLGLTDKSGWPDFAAPTRWPLARGQQSESDLLAGATGRQGRRPMRATARTDSVCSRWSQFLVKDFVVPQAGGTEMDRIVVTRPSLIDPSIPQKPIVLLTGAWPGSRGKSVVELDVTIDQRFGWIDKEAERLAEVAGGSITPVKRLPVPWVNVLALRYYLVKLLRVIEFFYKVQPPRKNERVHVIADRADRDDVAIIAAFCRRAGAKCTVQWSGEEEDGSASAAEREEGWRKTLRQLISRLPEKELESDRHRRVVLCGNPRYLDSLCRVLHDRKCHIWWLYDRLAVKSFFQWRRKGIEQLTCQDDSFVPEEAEEPIDLPKLEFRGMDLRNLVSEWLGKRLASRRHDQRRWQRQIERHFHEIKPDFLVMDEDATPMKRIALAIMRRNGGGSYVIQHGAPVARFGFAPLEADGFFAWGRSTREQLQIWDVPPERIHITGSPAHDLLYEAIRKTRRKARKPDVPARILLLATVAPRDDRPDVIEMNMNSRTYGEMIEAAFAAVEGIPDGVLVIKPHPRSRDDSAVRDAASRHPKVKAERSKASSLEASLRGVDCVLSCLSSAGIEATLANLPVIQLVPRGAGRILPFDRWGLLGSASNAQELLPLIQEALKMRGRVKNPVFGDVFANASCWARSSKNVPDSANRIADILLDCRLKKQSSTEPRIRQEQGSSMAAMKR